MMRKALVFSISPLLALFFPVLVQAAPDAIYFNGKILTVDEHFSVHSAFAFEDGKFTAVGGDEVLDLAGEATDIMDLEARTVIPGLIDNHNHFIRGAQHWNQSLRLDGVRTRAEAMSMLEEYAVGLTEGEWLLVLGGWNEEQFTDDQTGFSLAELDHIAGNRPVFLQVQYSHAYVNTAFLELIGADIKSVPLPSQSPQKPSALEMAFGPPLAELVARDESGRATSRLNGGMGMVIQTSTLMQDLTYDQIKAGIVAAQSDYNALGLTTVYDPGGALPSQESYQAVEDLHGSGELTLRIFRTAVDDSLGVHTVRRLLNTLRPLPKWFSNLVFGMIRDAESSAEMIKFVEELGPLKEGDDFYDILAVGEVFYPPLHDSMDAFAHGHRVSDRAVDEVRLLMTEVMRRGVPSQIHAVDTDTIEIYLDIAEALAHGRKLEDNLITIAHGEGVTPTQLQRMRAMNIGLQARSMSVIRSRDGLIENYTERALAAPPLRTIASSGIRWGLGTDGTKAAQINPMRTLQWAVTGNAMNGDQILDSNQLLSKEEALAAHTRQNAILVGRETSLGQIRPGYLADFVVLDQDYLEIDPSKISTIKATLTVVGGKVAHDARSRELVP